MNCIIVLLLFVQSAVVYTQTTRRASLLEYRAYMISVIEKTVQDIEDFQWCNLKVPDFTQDLEYNIFGRNIRGTVTYKNGYVVTIQHLDVTQASVQQVWQWRTVDRVGQVDVRGQMRLHDVVLGFDVEAVIDDRERRYSSTFTHRLLSFDFSILKHMPTQNITVTVRGTQPRSTNRMSYMPTDDDSDLLGASFDPDSTRPAVLSWASDIFTPIARNVVTTKVDFPEVCYNC
ncbi:hypothetical protein ABMA28_007547 [Loxostege sticticalis]|uniref:Uncharacterized protein n=1 Tax=Loxostege sticticalis TaxID=481309 RepID=A0ABD0SHY2_LOXSC